MWQLLLLVFLQIKILSATREQFMRYEWIYGFRSIAICEVNESVVRIPLYII